MFRAFLFFEDFIPFLLVPIALALFAKAVSATVSSRSWRLPLFIFFFSAVVYFSLYIVLPLLGAVGGKLFVLFFFLCMPLAASSAAAILLRQLFRRRRLSIALGFAPVWIIFFVLVVVAIHPHGTGVLAAPFEFSWEN